MPCFAATTHINVKADSNHINTVIHKSVKSHSVLSIFWVIDRESS